MLLFAYAHGNGLSTSLGDATKLIQNDIGKNSEDDNTSELCEDFLCCKISESESCSLKNMTHDETVLVLPGGETRCIFSYSTDFGM